MHNCINNLYGCSFSTKHVCLSVHSFGALIPRQEAHFRYNSRDYHTINFNTFLV